MARKGGGRKRHGSKPSKEGASRRDVRVQGRLASTPSGFGFVTPDGGGNDIFIPPRHMGGALDGDHVEVSLLEDDSRFDSRGPAGRIVSVLGRSKTFIVGELLSGHVVRPLSKRLPSEIKVSGARHDASRGNWVRLRLLDDGSRHTETLRGSIEDVYGKAGRVESDLLAIVGEYGLCPAYSESQDKDASKLKPARFEDRANLTSMTAVTIDPHDAKDFDDAISLSRGEKDGELLLGVHIADVAAWVRPGSKWDKEASKRSFSSYLPGMFMPMLPKPLTKLMSLNEGRESLAHSVLFTVRESDGAIISSRRTRSTIKVAARLNFDEVQSFIEGEEQKGWRQNVKDMMSRLVPLSRKMRERRRREEQFLELATSEIRVLCDERTKEILGLERRRQRESDQLVEDCMLAANSAVAAEMIERNLPGVFRVHPEPTPEKLEELSAILDRAFALNPGDLSSRTACNHFLRSLPDDHKRPVIVSMFLRSMPRASYLEEPALHYGLGKYRYSHFTSPIRRYPDLLVHQQLWAADSKGRLRSKAVMASFADDCSRKEERNDEALFAANDRLKLHYLSEKGVLADGTLYEAVINKVSSSGLLCDIPELGIYGFVPAQSLPGQLSHRRVSGKLKSIKGRASFKLGDFIYLQLDRIDLARGSAVFRPVI